MEEKQISFRFYKSFFTNDIHELAPIEKSKLIQFFRRLQANPYSPDFEEKEGFYAVEFSPTRVVYWKLIVKGYQPVGIDVLKMVTLRTLSEK